MNEIKRGWDLLSDDERRYILGQITSYFETERNEKIGAIATEHILDFFLRTVGSTVYNRALDDMKPFLEKNLNDTLLDIDVSLRREEERRIEE